MRFLISERTEKFNIVKIENRNEKTETYFEKLEKNAEIFQGSYFVRAQSQAKLMDATRTAQTRATASSHWNMPQPSTSTAFNIRSVQADPNSFPVQKIKINLELVPPNRLKINMTPYHSIVVTIAKSMPSASLGADGKRYSILIPEAEQFVKALRECKQLQVTIEQPPKEVLNMIANFEVQQVPTDLAEVVNPQVLEQLFPYQKGGVRFILERRGRAMIADEMGLGKSIQALVAARAYKSEWPLLIICPSSVKAAWRNQLNKFYPNIKRITNLDKSSDPLPLERTSNTVIIASYDLMAMENRLNDLVRAAYQVVIFDESHNLKEIKTKRTKAAIRVATVAKRVLLLSGTPALSRPAELYSQIYLIDSKLFPNFFNFAERYCAGKQGKFCYEAKGCTNSDELKAILLRRVMIRRLKADVLKELPPKRREVIYLSGKSIDDRIKKLQRFRQEFERLDFSRFKPGTNGQPDNENLVQYYRETGIAKAAAVVQHITENVFCDGELDKKVLIFAHHQVVMDTIQAAIAKASLRWIRIDGSTPQQLRGEYCDEFQNDSAVKVALLSISAAGVGITLTAASIVIFAELHWNPGHLVQAEDRAHRVGQQDSVYVQYLLAKNTADDVIWRMVQSKLDILGQVNLSSDTFRTADKTIKNVGTSQGQKSDIRRYMSLEGTTDDGAPLKPVQPSTSSSSKMDVGSANNKRPQSPEVLTIDEDQEEEDNDDDDFDKEEMAIVRKRSAEDNEGSQNDDDWHLEPIIKKAHSDETQNDQDDCDWLLLTGVVFAVQCYTSDSVGVVCNGKYCVESLTHSTSDGCKDHVYQIPWIGSLFQTHGFRALCSRSECFCMENFCNDGTLHEGIPKGKVGFRCFEGKNSTKTVACPQGVYSCYLSTSDQHKEFACGPAGVISNLSECWTSSSNCFCNQSFCNRPLDVDFFQSPLIVSTPTSTSSEVPTMTTTTKSNDSPTKRPKFKNNLQRENLQQFSTKPSKSSSDAGSYEQDENNHFKGIKLVLYTSAVMTSLLTYLGTI
ncbi:hypothetical protein WR25_14472 [Diploscapter pachys]|uniref:SWI/SNF-related matrix-associated actin-dependent regulator of chromatin subfamily A-like protein 1 n=1 Tax=Diploscapter pachys TaxID=2018661 RepID=A0A2A2LD77_9BILA|nr:hypothetical protein WR25_14472 [Diploscapter pachys]